MNIIPSHRHLLGRADALLLKANDAERSGDARAIADARREGGRIQEELSHQLMSDRVQSLFKSALKYSAQDRKAMAQTGEAMSNGEFPIRTAQDVADAVEAWKVPGPHQTTEARNHIRARATALGALDKQPDDWRGDTSAGDDNPSKVARAKDLRKFGR